MTRTIQKPELAHPPLAAIGSRRDELNATIAKLRASAADIRRRLTERGDEDTRQLRVDALAAGTTIEDRAPLQDELSAVLRDLRDAEDALEIVNGRFRTETHNASRIISQQHADEHREMLSRLWSGIASAAAARIEIDNLHRDFSRLGLTPIGILEAGDAVFSEPLNRASSAAVELRRAARNGLINPTAIPHEIQ